MNKNMLKKTLISLGSVGTVVAPIASAVAYAPNTITSRQATPVDMAKWQAFIARVNDKTNEEDYLNANYNDNLRFTFMNSEFYKDNAFLQSGVWNLSEKNDLYACLVTLLQSNEFSDEAKVTLAKHIINNEAVADVYANFGFNPSLTVTKNAIKNVTGSLVDPSRIASNTVVSIKDFDQNKSTTLNLVGKTGVNTDFSPSAYHDQELEISNADALAYFMGAMNSTSQFKDLINVKLEEYESSIFATNSNPKATFNSLFDNIKAIGQQFTTTKYGLEDIAKLSCFSALQTVDITAATTTKDLYHTLMNSNLAKALFGASTNDKLVAFDAFKDNSIQQKLAFAEIMQAIGTSLAPVASVKPAQFTFLEEKMSDTISGERLNSIITFAKTLLESSKNFTTDVQLQSRTSILGKHSLSIKGDFNTITWNAIPDYLTIPYWILGKDPFSMSQGFSKTISQQAELPKVLKTDKIVRDFYPVMAWNNKPDGYPALNNINKNSVGELHFKNTLIISTKDNKVSERATKEVWQSEAGLGNHHETNWDIGNFDFPNNEGGLSIDPTKEQFPEITNFDWEITSSQDPASYTFKSLNYLGAQTALNNALKQAVEEAKTAYQDFLKNPSSDYDPNAPIAIKLTLDSISIGQMSYWFDWHDNQGDIRLTWLKNFKANFTYTIIQNEVIKN